MIVTPAWHGICARVRRDLTQSYQVDHGEMGVDIECVDRRSQNKRCTKEYRSLCNHVLSCFPAPYFTENEELCEKTRNRSRTKRNCLKIHSSKEDRQKYILKAGGKHLQRLDVLLLEDETANNVDDLHLPRVSKEFGKSILQINSASVNGRVYCGMRNSSGLHILKLSLEKNLELRDVCHIDQKLSDYCLSPYCEGDILYTTNNGHISFHNIYERFQDVVLNPINDEDSNLFCGCSFGAHPRCVLGACPTSMRLFDVRQSPLKSTCLLQLPLLSLASEDKISGIMKHPTNSYLHFLAMTHSVVAIDERYQNKLVIKWSHMMDYPPTICNISNSSSDLFILLGSTMVQDTTLIHATQPNIQNSVLEAKCSSRQLQTPTKVLKQLLKMVQYPRGDSALRMSEPLRGLEAFQSKNSEDLHILQMTQAGDMFIQNMSLSSPENAVDSPSADNQRHDELMEAWMKWAKIVPGYKRTGQDDKTHEASYLVKILAVQQRHLCDCRFCCSCDLTSSSQDSNEVCPSCGNHIDVSSYISEIHATCGSLMSTSQDVSREVEKAQSQTSLETMVDPVNQVAATLLQKWVDNNIRVQDILPSGTVGDDYVMTTADLALAIAPPDANVLESSTTKHENESSHLCISDTPGTSVKSVKRELNFSGILSMDSYKDSPIRRESQFDNSEHLKKSRVKADKFQPGDHDFVEVNASSKTSSVLASPSLYSNNQSRPVCGPSVEVLSQVDKLPSSRGNVVDIVTPSDEKREENSLLLSPKRPRLSLSRKCVSRKKTSEEGF